MISLAEADADRPGTTSPSDALNAAREAAELARSLYSFVICKAGKPLVQVTRLARADDPANPPRRRLGLLAGHCSVPDDFDQIASAMA